MFKLVFSGIIGGWGVFVWRLYCLVEPAADLLWNFILKKEGQKCLWIRFWTKTFMRQTSICKPYSPNPRFGFRLLLLMTEPLQLNSATTYTSKISCIWRSCTYLAAILSLFLPPLYFVREMQAGARERQSFFFKWEYLIHNVCKLHMITDNFFKSRLSIYCLQSMWHFWRLQFL